LSSDRSGKCRRGVDRDVDRVGSERPQRCKPQERSDSTRGVKTVGARQAHGWEQGSGVQAVLSSRPEADRERTGEQEALRGVQLKRGNKTLKGKTPRTLGPERGNPRLGRSKPLRG